ncbi:hypothetical protein HPULCUR_001537 [Helicostylum pulchrum]|uniref:Uncharacterized protein n=1 Tax=Helicostylum pulchrum TaxID=562976 RepID=A0ABP9XN01_9FUNG
MVFHYNLIVIPIAATITRTAGFLPLLHIGKDDSLTGLLGLSAWKKYISIPFINNGYGGATTNNKDVYSKSNDYNALVEYGLKKNRHGADLKFIDSHACFVKRLSYPEAKVHKAWGDMAIMPLEHVYNIN